MSYPYQNILLERCRKTASSIDEIIKGLENPPRVADEDDLARLNDSLISCAQTIKDDFVKKLLELDPLAPDEMIRLSNSCLKLLSHFPFDTDSLYLSVKKFMVGAHKLARAEASIKLVDLSSQLEVTVRLARILSIVKDDQERIHRVVGESLKDIERMEPWITYNHPKADLEALKEPLACMKRNMGRNSKALLDVYNLIDKLGGGTPSQSSAERKVLCVHLAGLEADLRDARAQLLSNCG